MKFKLFSDRKFLKPSCAIFLALAANVGDGSSSASGVEQSFAEEAVSKPLVPKAPISLRPAVESPMSRPTAFKVAAAEPNAINIEVATTLASEGETAFSAGEYLNAAKLFNQAAAETSGTKADHERNIAYLQMEAEALFRQGKTFADNEALDKSIERLTNLLTTIDKAKSPRNWAATQNDLGLAIAVSGARFGDHSKIDKGISAIRAALEIRTFEQSPDEWAASQIELAKGLIAGGRISATNDMLEEAIRTCHTVIDKKPDAGIEGARWLAKSVMSNALQLLAQRETDSTAMFSAKSNAEDALTGIKRETQPFDWAQTMNYLANSHREMGSLQNDPSMLILALEQYRQSLEVLTREAYPIEWAQTQLDMGNAYFGLAYLQNDTAMLERAMDSYIKSLRVRSAQATPVEWAMSRNNYGAALGKLLDLRPDANAADRSDVVLALRDAVRVTTLERAPLDWAMMQVHLGKSLVALWNRKQIDVPYERQAAVDALMQNQVKHPRAGGIAEHEAALAMIMKRADSVDDLREAISAFGEATKVYSKEEFPLKWLHTQSEIARTLQSIGLKLGQAREYDAAIAIYREQQTLLQFKNVPAEWANLENSIAGALYQVGLMKSDASKLEEAAQVYRNAILAMPDDQPYGYSYIKLNLARLECDLGNIASDNAAFQKSVEIYKELKELGTARGDKASVERFSHESAQCQAAMENQKTMKKPK